MPGDLGGGGISGLGGLTQLEAARRLQLDGPNEPPRRRRRGSLVVLAEVISEPLIALLVVATALYFAFGEPQDAAVLGASVVVVIGLGVYQESRAEHALEALRSLAEPEALVHRDGRLHRIPSRDLVRGDWVAVAQGTRVPADGEVRVNGGLVLDEAILTGESVPVRKSVGTGQEPWVPPGGDGLPFVYAQTMVVHGEGWVELRSTGARTEAGRIGVALAQVETASPLIRQQTRPLVVGVTLVAVAVTVLLAVLVGLQSQNWIEGLLAGTAVAIGLLPEEIPVVTTVYSVLGARRMARHQALARRFGTIPTLGCLTVLCTDKTGTLTMNRMRLAELQADRDAPPRPMGTQPVTDERARTLLAWALRANDPLGTDPMERAIAVAARAHEMAEPDPTHLVEHIPFDANTRSVRNLWRAENGEGIAVAVKGAPEPLLETCRLDERDREGWRQAYLAMAREGYRVLGVARGELPASDPPPAGSPLHFLGLLGFIDPLRPGVPEAVAECRQAGVRVIMITGDHPETAREIARQAGFARTDRVVTGAELSRWSEAERDRVTGEVDIYARILPEQKLDIVRGLRAAGEIVGMTGDGVNDAPALRSAHIGIAMGERGTDVAREAASLVLLDDAFPTVVRAIRMGRRVHENMRKAIYYVLAIHVVIGGMALLPVMLGLPILLFPVEIVFLELVVDPVSALTFEAEPEERDLMRSPPRDPEAPLVGRRAIAGSLMMGASGLAASLVVYGGAFAFGVPVDAARALGFTTLMVANLTMVLLCRSTAVSALATLRIRNVVAWGVTAFGVGLLLAAVFLPGLSTVFQFSAPTPLSGLIAIAAGVASVLLNDPVKRHWLYVEPHHVPAGTMR